MEQRAKISYGNAHCTATYFYFWTASHKYTLLKMSLCKNFALHEKMENRELQKSIAYRKKTKVRFEIRAPKVKTSVCINANIFC